MDIPVHASAVMDDVDCYFESYSSVEDYIFFYWLFTVD